MNQGTAEFSFEELRALLPQYAIRLPTPQIEYGAFYETEFLNNKKNEGSFWDIFRSMGPKPVPFCFDGRGRICTEPSMVPYLVWSLTVNVGIPISCSSRPDTYTKRKWIT